jgi:hypothetical protein
MAVILGVLGARNELTKQILQDEILNPILDDLGGTITRLVLPADSLCSTFIECWANRKDIPCASVKSDFINYGRKASVMRDLRIEKESSVFLVFEGPRSRYYLNKAEQIAKRYPERRVYIVHSNDICPTLLEVEAPKGIPIADDTEAELLKKPTQTLDQMWGFRKKTPSPPCLLVDD